MSESVDISFFDERGKKCGISLELRAISGGTRNLEPLLVISNAEADENGEECVQLLEDCRYRYRLKNAGDAQLQSNAIIFQEGNRQEGTIETGTTTGQLVIVLKSANICYRAAVEVRSSKLNYRDDYRAMLDAIAAKSTELLLALTASSRTRVVPDIAHDPQTNAQRLAFLIYLFENSNFTDAIEQIISHPIMQLQEELESRDIRKGARRGSAFARHLGRPGQRSLLPSTHPSYAIMNAQGIVAPSLPSHIPASTKRDIVDIPENQFAKFALQEFASYMGKLRENLERSNTFAARRILKDALRIESKFDEWLTHDVFRDVSEPQMLELGSPALQRRAGYRELYQAWIRYQLAAALSWEGADDVYSAGQRDLEKLYEYWAFFFLMDAITNVFHLPLRSLKTLFDFSPDTFGLKLKSKKETIIEGQSNPHNRYLHIKFTYNRQFSPNMVHQGERGSWTRPMRPDYTLSLWPTDFSEEEAEDQEIITHIHFDAKYKLESIADLYEKENVLSGDDINVDDQANLNETIAKRGATYNASDLIKMHAYRDAIRRSEGAYILYPGNQEIEFTKSNEVLPGIGAFPLRPQRNGSADITHIEAFLKRVAMHVSDRASERDQIRFHAYKARMQSRKLFLDEVLGERSTDGGRDFVVSERLVLVASIDSERQISRIMLQKRFPLRISDDQGNPAPADPRIGLIRYIALCNRLSGECVGVWPVRHSETTIVTGAMLNQEEYSLNEKIQLYAVFKIDSEKAFSRWKWTLGSLEKLGLQSPKYYGAITITTLDNFFDAHEPWQMSMFP